MSNHSPQFTDELIRAYLDGELSTEERQRVEQVMEQEPRYRQMFDELKALRESLQTLPSYQLDNDFHTRVLDRALNQTPEIDAAAIDTTAPPTTNSPLLSWRGASWRRFFWAGMAIAAAVLIMVFFRNEEPRIGVALNNSTESFPARSSEPFAEADDAVVEFGLRKQNESAGEADADPSAARGADSPPVPQIRFRSRQTSANNDRTIEVVAG